jgi:acetylornithine deacetylase/succinyl-diaminopimelate desuccinylase-like protein
MKRHPMAARLLLFAHPMADSPRFDVSVILPFGDDEEAVGIAVRRTAEHLRGLSLSFEIIAIDEDSGDNSHAVLALLRGEVPELRVTHASGRGRGVDVGAARAQGALLLVSTPDVASASLDGAGDACRRLLAGESDAEVALARFTIAHRIRALPAFRGARLVGAAMHRRLAKRLQVRNLSVRIAGPTGVAAKKTAYGRLRAFARIG